jgi:signal transduction histidine kinase
MNRLIGDLVDVAAIDAGRLAVAPSRGDAASLLAEAVDAFRASSASKGVVLEAAGADKALVAEFDRDRILQVLANLITNAIKFTPAGGKIEVRGEWDGNELHFCVSDTGVGIRADMLDAVFARFWQVNENDRRGLGLGLYIARCIVDAHGGRIWAESTLGAGSRFHFTLPRVRARS